MFRADIRLAANVMPSSGKGGPIRNDYFNSGKGAARASPYGGAPVRNSGGMGGGGMPLFNVIVPCVHAQQKQMSPQSRVMALEVTFLSDDPWLSASTAVHGTWP